MNSGSDAVVLLPGGDGRGLGSGGVWAPAVRGEAGPGTAEGCGEDPGQEIFPSLLREPMRVPVQEAATTLVHKAIPALP